MWLLIPKALYFFLPAYFANMAPVLFKKIPWAGVPVQERIFGKNKTWRGLVAAPVTAAVIFALQKYLHAKGFQLFSLIDYDDFSLALGFLMGSGAILGDLLKSYYKRREKIPPGEKWFPWDQLDFVFGGLLFTFFFFVPPIEVVLVLVLASPLLHIVTNHLGYWMRIRESKW